jgi:hypothetical protein
MLNVVKSAPALAAGCTVVLKPHPWTPLDAFFIAQVAEEAGIPPGVFNVVTGHGEVGDELTSNPMVDMVTFTGSTATGRRIMASAAPTVKRVQLELGGKSAQVVLADVQRTTPAHRFRCVPHTGRGCGSDAAATAGHLLDAHKEGVTAAVPDQIGDRDPSSVLGPLIREQQRAPGLRAVGRRAGAELFTDEGPDGSTRVLHEPTVFIGTNDMRISWRRSSTGAHRHPATRAGRRRPHRQRLDLRPRRRRAAHRTACVNVARQIRAGACPLRASAGKAVADSVGGGQGPGWGRPGRYRPDRCVRWLSRVASAAVGSPWAEDFTEISRSAGREHTAELFDLLGQVAVVTGGSRIGRGRARSRSCRCRRGDRSRS